MNQGELIVVLAIIIIALIFIVKKQMDSITELKSKKKSIEVKHGNKIEQFIPFMKDYKYDSTYFRSLGSPVDGIQFEDDEIIILEFKTGQSRLSEKQKNIKRIIEDGKVRFEEIRI